MAAQAAVLTIKKDFDRLSPSAYEKFSGLPIGNIIDAQGRVGALDYRIKPITTAHAFSGPVITIDAGPRDNLAAWVALDYVQAGDVMMIATGGYELSSVVGDLFVGMAKNAGVAGIVTDGVVRDLVGLEAVGIPVFALGISSNSPQKNGPGTIGLPIVIGGMSVASGDIACGDRDGVVVVKKDRVDGVVRELGTVIAKEASMEAAVKAGKTIPDWVASAKSNLVIDYIA
ncbi:MAG: hypothetical protein LJE64_10710 [Desulfofustis sp.]|jgi:4-hydroxy-4-methyl-2-oxoglutarate aldolase|nr:hypothetical protein [Desulfofustis sp.]